MEEKVIVPEGIAKLAAAFCNCGDPSSAWQTVLDYLENYSLVDDDWQKRTLKLDSGEKYIVAYLLTHYDLLEHGGSVGGSWITWRGEEVRDFLRFYTAQWTDYPDIHFYHGEMVIGGGQW